MDGFIKSTDVFLCSWPVSGHRKATIYYCSRRFVVCHFSVLILTSRQDFFPSPECKYESALSLPLCAIILSRSRLIVFRIETETEPSRTWSGIASSTCKRQSACFLLIPIIRKKRAQECRDRRRTRTPCRTNRRRYLNKLLHVCPVRLATLTVTTCKRDKSGSTAVVTRLILLCTCNCWPLHFVDRQHFVRYSSVVRGS